MGYYDYRAMSVRFNPDKEKELIDYFQDKGLKTGIKELYDFYQKHQEVKSIEDVIKEALKEVKVISPTDKTQDTGIKEVSNKAKKFIGAFGK
jgi:hypothetical protein